MKQGWEIKKLGDVCIVERGSSPRPIKKYQTNSSDGVNWIKIGDTKGVNKYIHTTKEKITKEGAEKSRYVKEGDFILSNSMSFGKPFIMKTDGYIHDGWFVFRLPNYLDKDFFYYLLTSPNVQEQIQSLGAGAIVKNISGDLVKKVDISYPNSIQEQQRIVSILDEAFTAIDKAKANAEQNLNNAAALFESYLQGVFEKKGDGWEEKKLGEVCVVKRGSSPRPIKKYQTNSLDGVNWIKIGDTKGVDKYIHSTKEKITKEGAEKSRYVKEGDFILSNSMSFGNPYIMKTDGYIHDGWFVFRLPDSLDKNYFYYLLTSPNVQNQIQSLGAGAIVKNISGELVKKVDVFYPKSLEEQQTIVHKLDALRVETQKLETIYQKKIDDLEELKKSILQKAFAGELRGGELVEPKTEKAIVV